MQLCFWIEKREHCSVLLERDIDGCIILYLHTFSSDSCFKLLGLGWGSLTVDSQTTYFLYFDLEVWIGIFMHFGKALLKLLTLGAQDGLQSLLKRSYFPKHHGVLSMSQLLTWRLRYNVSSWTIMQGRVCEMPSGSKWHVNEVLSGNDAPELQVSTYYMVNSDHLACSIQVSIWIRVQRWVCPAEFWMHALHSRRLERSKNWATLRHL